MCFGLFFYFVLGWNPEPHTCSLSCWIPRPQHFFIVSVQWHVHNALPVNNDQLVHNSCGSPSNSWKWHMIIKHDFMFTNAWSICRCFPFEWIMFNIFTIQMPTDTLMKENRSTNQISPNTTSATGPSTLEMPAQPLGSQMLGKHVSLLLISFLNY